MGNMSSREKLDGKSVKHRSSLSRFSSTSSFQPWNKNADKKKKSKKTASLIRDQCSSSTLYESSSSSVHKVPLIEKYTDSQLTLLSNKSQQISQADRSTSILSTKLSTSTLNTHISENLADLTHGYSSELLLKELYMLCETSPERRRDRDR